MFTWIQTYLQKHFPVLLTILLAILIVSFVFTIGNMPGLSGKRGTSEQPFFGKNLAFAPERQLLERKAQTHILINYGQWASQEDILEDFASIRTGMLYIADALGIPGPDQQAFKNFIHEHNRFQGPDGYDEALYSQFLMQVSAYNMDKELITEVLEEDYRIDKVNELLQGPGYITPFEALFQAKVNETSWQIQVATIDYDAFSPSIDITPEEIQAHYDLNQESYRIPPRLKTKIVRFNDDDYLPQAATQTITEEELNRQFSMRKSRYEALVKRPEPELDENGVALPLPEITIDQVRDFVIRDIHMAKAKEYARAAAEEFAYTLFDKEIAFESDKFKELLAKESLTLEPLSPMAQNNVTTQAGLNSSTLKEAFALLSSSRYFSDPIENSGQFILFFNAGTEPSFVPDLDIVKQQVVAEITAEKKREAFIARGVELKEAFAKAANADEFKTKAETEGLGVQAFGPLKLTEPVEGLDVSIRRKLVTLDQGEVSDMVATETSGYFVMVSDKSVPDLTVIDEPVAQILENSKQMGTISGNQAVQELVIAERAKTDWRVTENR